MKPRSKVILGVLLLLAAIGLLYLLSWQMHTWTPQNEKWWHDPTQGVTLIALFLCAPSGLGFIFGGSLDL